MQQQIRGVIPAGVQPPQRMLDQECRNRQRGKVARDRLRQHPPQIERMPALNEIVVDDIRQIVQVQKLITHNRGIQHTHECDKTHHLPGVSHKKPPQLVPATRLIPTIGYHWTRRGCCVGGQDGLHQILTGMIAH